LALLATLGFVGVLVQCVRRRIARS
jgi:hypothetical protein